MEVNAENESAENVEKFKKYEKTRKRNKTLEVKKQKEKAKQSVPETGKEEVEEIEGTQKGEGRDESENGRFDIGRESEKRHRYWNSSNRRRSSCAIVVGLEERK